MCPNGPREALLRRPEAPASPQLPSPANPIRDAMMKFSVMTAEKGLRRRRISCAGGHEAAVASAAWYAERTGVHCKSAPVPARNAVPTLAAGAVTLILCAICCTV